VRSPDKLRTLEFTPAGINRTFWTLLVAEPIAGSAIVDVGSGAGRVALAVAPRCGRVVGIERDRELVAEARQRTAALGHVNAEFVVADADQLPSFREPGGGVRIEPGIVVAHLFLSDALVSTAAASLERGGALIFAGLHVDHRGRTGRPSRFAYDEARMRHVLAASRFAVEYLGVERDVQECSSLEEALGPMTRAHIVGKARRR
jgi:SAM-dependent methyltransferase